VRVPVLLRQPFGPLDVFDDDRRVERDGGRVAADRRHRRRDVDVRQAAGCADAPDPTAFVVLPEGVRVGQERPAGEGEHLREHRLDVERAEEPRGRLQQEPQPPEILGVLPLGVV